ASPRAIGFPLMSTSSVSPASFWSSTTEPGPSWSSSRMASRVRPISTVTSSGMSSSSSKLRGVSPAAVSVDSAMASPPLDARGDAHRVAAALHARRGEEARPPLDAHQDRPLAPGAQREHLARAEPEHVTQPHAVRAELGRDLELDRREHGAQAVAEAGARRLALAAHARLEAMAERIEPRVRQEDPEADRLREARRHARELEELEAAHVEGGHLAEERAERGAQPAHEAVHHQLEAREPAAQVALLAGEIEPLHAARRRAAAAGDG